MGCVKLFFNVNRKFANSISNSISRDKVVSTSSKRIFDYVVQIGQHMQGWTATKRQGVKEKEAQKG